MSPKKLTASISGARVGFLVGPSCVPDKEWSPAVRNPHASISIYRHQMDACLSLPNPSRSVAVLSALLFMAADLRTSFFRTTVLRIAAMSGLALQATRFALCDLEQAGLIKRLTLRIHESRTDITTSTSITIL